MIMLLLLMNFMIIKVYASETNMSSYPLQIFIRLFVAQSHGINHDILVLPMKQDTEIPFLEPEEFRPRYLLNVESLGFPLE